jgi:hypothetical protein
MSQAQNRRLGHSVRIGLALAVLAAGGASMTARQANTLTSEEKAAGWRLLFDGTTLNGWRGFKAAAPAGWSASDGAVARTGPGGDLMTAEQFGDFELQLEWKVGPAGNSGIMFRVTSDAKLPYETGPEMQVLDNAGHKDGAVPATAAGSNYALHAPVRDVTRPVGEWNAVRLIVRGAHVEHWLNGVKLLEYELWSPDWEARVKASKFATMPGYGRAKRGHLVLQDHNDPVWYRNIRIRPL